MNRCYSRPLLILLAGLPLLLVLGLTGCATTPQVSIERDASVNFSRYKTFTILPLSATGASLDPGVVIRLARPAEQTVREILTAKGYAEADRDKADFAVHVHGESLPRLEPTWGYMPYPAYAGWRGGAYYGSPMMDMQLTEDRRLIVDIYDGASRKPAWAGWMERSGYGPVDAQRVQDGIRQILENFPTERKVP